MKQLIPQSKIDEAANRFAEQRRLDSRGYPPKVWFNEGVQFALNEIQPLIVEFAEWINDNDYHRIHVGEEKGQWTTITYNDFDCFTTQQLLEEFINSKNK